MTPEQLNQLAENWLLSEDGGWEQIPSTNTIVMRLGKNWDRFTEEKRIFLAGYAAAQPQWIDVRDRLPEMNQRCFITDGESMYDATFCKRLGYKEPTFQFLGIMRTVTHWMPLPPNPQSK